MSPGPMHPDLVAHRRESATKPKDIGPLLTNTPLPLHREKKQPAQPQKRRKRNPPTTPVYTFDPRQSTIPTGKHGPTGALPISSGPSALELSTSPYNEQQMMTPSADREIYTPLREGYDAQRLSRIVAEHPSADHSTLSYPNTSYADVNDMNSVPPESYDSPGSYGSSSSPAPSDQSPADFATSGTDYTRPAPPPVTMCSYGGQVYVPVPVVHQGPYGYSQAMDHCPDRPVQGHSTPYFDPGPGRPGMHGGPAWPANNGHPYPHGRRA